MISHVWLFVTPWTIAHQAPLSMEFLGKNTGVGCQQIFWTKDWTCVCYISCIGRWILYHCTTEMGIPDHLTCLLRNLHAGKKQQLKWDVEQQTGPKLAKEYIKAVYYHPAYLTYIRRTSYEMMGWMKHKLKSRLLGEMSRISDTQMTPHLWQKVKKN